ncbi:MAG: hypothetical protein GXX99_08295 [Clostridiales bacterium]|nr:hypothetical protein [Clostridiales bacterium]
MEWNRARGILIAVLLLVNLFLFGSGQSVRRQKTRLPEDYIQTVAAALERRGLEIDSALIPRDRIFLPRLTISTGGALQPLIEALLQQQAPATLVEGDATHYSSPAGEVVLLTQTDLVFTPSEPALDLPEALRLLGQGGFHRGDFAELEGQRLQQLYEDTPIDGCGVALLGGRLTGRLLVLDAPQAVYPETDLIDPPNALMLFAAAQGASAPSGGRTVLGVSVVYRIGAQGLNTLTATPAYRITTERGAYLVDAVSGAVSPSTDIPAELPPDLTP